MSLGVLSCERYDDRAGTLVPAFYLCNTIGIYAYFNDYQFFRIVVDDNNYAKGQIEIFDGKNWIITSNVKDAQIYTMDFNKLVKLLVGGSTFAYGGTGVEAACQWACMIAEDETHGYNQGHRDGPQYDCSSLVYYAFKDAGGFSELATVSGNWATTTYYMISVYTDPSVGFTWIPMSAPDPDDLYRGDILLFEGDPGLGTGHTAIYLGDRQIVHASWCEGSAPTYINQYGQEVIDWDHVNPDDGDGSEICIASYFPYWYDMYGNYYEWDGVLRYEGGFGGSGGGNF